MAWIDTLEQDEVDGYRESIYNHQIKNRGGTVSNIIKIHSLNETAFKSFMEFSKLLFFPSELKRKTKEMIAVAVSSYNDCHY